MRQSKLIFFILTAFVFSSCTKEKRERLTNAAPSGTTGPATLSTIQTDIFRLGCSVSGCHDNRANPAGSLSLTNASQTYALLVDKFSTEATGVKLIVPGDPDNSYLVGKLKGTHLLMGGSGVRMPQYAASLSEGDLTRITDWITAGAQAN